MIPWIDLDAAIPKFIQFWLIPTLSPSAAHFLTDELNNAYLCHPKSYWSITWLLRIGPLWWAVEIIIINYHFNSITHTHTHNNTSSSFPLLPHSGPFDSIVQLSNHDINMQADNEPSLFRAAGKSNRVSFHLVPGAINPGTWHLFDLQHHR